MLFTRTKCAQLSCSRAEMATPEPYVDSYLDDVRPAPGYFDLFRYGNFPTLYRSIKTSQSSDILESGLIFAAVILAFSLLLIVPGVRRWHVSERTSPRSSSRRPLRQRAFDRPSVVGAGSYRLTHGSTQA